LKKITPRFFGLLLGAWFLAGIGVVEETAVANPAPISQITVQRTWCYGICPIDSVTFNSDGRASYAGFQNTPRRGLYTGVLPLDQFRKMASFLEEQNYFELKPEIGSGNIDASDFMVSVVRGNLPYNVTFRRGESRTLEEKMRKTLLVVADSIDWKRDERASESGVRGTLRRPLTVYEKHSLRDQQPGVKSFPMKFALVTLQSTDVPNIEFSTRSDGEGRFQFFAPPGRYQLSAETYNFSERRRLGDPLLLAKSQTVIVETKKFATPILSFEDRTPPQPKM
jgi:hypothetical protein